MTVKSGNCTLTLDIVSANFPEIGVLTIPYNQGQEPRMDFPRLPCFS